MDIFDYLGHQRRLQKEETERRLAPFEKPEQSVIWSLIVALWPRFLDALILILAIFALLVLPQWLESLGSDEQDVKSSKAEVKRYSGMLAQCLNGGALIDHNTKVGYFCGKAIEVNLR